MGSLEIKEAFESEEKFDIAERNAKQKVLMLLKRNIRPEFLNRIDDILVFSPLTLKEIQQIVSLQFQSIAAQLSQQGITLTATKEALNLIAREGFNPEYGGRPIKRVLQKKVVFHIEFLLPFRNHLLVLLVRLPSEVDRFLLYFFECYLLLLFLESIE